MSRIVSIDGQWLPEDEAKISVFDRGFLFADAIYEVTAVIGGRLIDYAGHTARLATSLAALKMVLPLSEADLLDLHRGLVTRNGLDEGLVYLQVSRGRAERDFTFAANLAPTLVGFTQSKAVLANPKAESGLTVATAPDRRWGRRDIKTVQLLYASLAKTAASAHGFDDVLLVEDGRVTEASSSNVLIVTAAGTLVTRPSSAAILPGLTRRSLLALAREARYPTEERAFSLREAQEASEVMISSATSLVLPVVRIDDEPVGDGRPGPVARHLREIYIAHQLAHAI